jgi:hypothetical protein
VRMPNRAVRAAYAACRTLHGDERWCTPQLARCAMGSAAEGVAVRACGSPTGKSWVRNTSRACTAESAEVLASAPYASGRPHSALLVCMHVEGERSGTTRRLCAVQGGAAH